MRLHSIFHFSIFSVLFPLSYLLCNPKVSYLSLYTLESVLIPTHLHLSDDDTCLGKNSETLCIPDAYSCEGTDNEIDGL